MLFELADGLTISGILDISEYRKWIKDPSQGKNPLYDSFDGVVGHAYGNEVIELLKRRLRIRTRASPIPQEKELLTYLESSVHPHVINGFLESFVELLKNSAYAKIRNENENNLEVRIQFNFIHDVLEIKYHDNAGGFPAEYLSSFQNYIKNMKQGVSEEAPKGEDKITYVQLGGQNQGMARFCNFIIRGQNYFHDEKSDVKHYDVPEGETDFLIENVDYVDGSTGAVFKGALITVRSPLKPYPCHSKYDATYPSIMSLFKGRGALEEMESMKDIKEMVGKNSNVQVSMNMDLGIIARRRSARSLVEKTKANPNEANQDNFAKTEVNSESKRKKKDNP